MIKFFVAGGFNMFVLLAFGIVMVATAVQFARNADPHRLSILRALTVALVFATLAGFVAGLIATCRFVMDPPEPIADPLPYLLGGFAESCSNLILGGGIAVITWVLVAVGVRRMPNDHS
jgi:hypothetical protein